MNANEQIAVLKRWKITDRFPSGKILGTTPEGYFGRTLPDWEHDIAAAHELWLEMPVGTRVWRTKKHWICAKINKFHCEADAAPAAISQAWLKWKGAK